MEVDDDDEEEEEGEEEEGREKDLGEIGTPKLTDPGLKV